MNGIRVLVIDDETAILRMMDLVLSRKGYQVDTADSGEKAVKMLHSNDYGLVITDMVMGRISGDEVLENVRNLKGDSIPVIAMSGTPWLMDGVQFDAVIPKPSPLKVLFEMVQDLLSPNIIDKSPLISGQASFLLTVGPNLQRVDYASTGPSIFPS